MMFRVVTVESAASCSWYVCAWRWWFNVLSKERRGFMLLAYRLCVQGVHEARANILCRTRKVIRAGGLSTVVTAATSDYAKLWPGTAVMWLQVLRCLLSSRTNVMRALQGTWCDCIRVDVHLVPNKFQEQIHNVLFWHMFSVILSLCSCEMQLGASV